MFRFLSLFLTFLPLATIANPASDCPSLQIPIASHWNQGNTHLCYAYAPATLIDQYRYSRGDKDRNHISSPFLLALKTMERYEQEGSTLKGGKIEHAFYTAKTFGTCSALKISDHLGNATTEVILQDFTRIHTLAQKSATDKKQAVNEVFKFLKNSEIKSEEWPAANEIEKSLALSLTEFLTRTLLPFCEGTKDLGTMPDVRLFFRPDGSGEEIVQEAQRLLKLNIAVGINFCANVATDPSHKGRMQDSKWVCAKNKNHSALIAGQKLVNGQCQFLVHDTGCEGYEKDSPGRCNQGQYWVDSESLTQNLHGIFWLE